MGKTPINKLVIEKKRRQQKWRTRMKYYMNIFY